MLVVITGHGFPSRDAVAEQALAAFRQRVGARLQHVDRREGQLLEWSLDPAEKVVRIRADEEMLTCNDHAAAGEAPAVCERHPEELADVGAWVAYPFASLFSDVVVRLSLLDAGIPGVTLPELLPTAPERAWRTWHFPFHAIPDLPELLISGHERAYLDWFLRRKTANPEAFSDADLDEYLRVFVKDGGIRAGLAFYRAAAMSARQNRELCAEAKLIMPVLAIGADQGSIADMAGPLREFASEVRGLTMPHCGHFIPEEQPTALANELRRFFAEGFGN